MSPEGQEVLKAGLDLLVAIIVLFLGWRFGLKFTAKWNLCQKKRETDIANLQQFYSLYGEFKEVCKIWRVIKQERDPNLEVTSDSRWSLLARACAVESKNEAITVKLATERNLDDDALRTLGYFRQAIQQLRESIRDGKEVPSCDREQPEYAFLNELVVKVGSIISSSPMDKSYNPKIGIERFRKVADVRKPHFKDAIKIFKEKGDLPN